jgi:AcrR family transcriptional regulator
LSIHTVLASVKLYAWGMPKLWDGTIETHRREVRAAVIAATAALVSQHGLRGVTMSQIAEEAGIGRATLYKYFPDVDAILTEWHDDQVTVHLAQLKALRLRDGTSQEQLRSVLERFSLTMFESAQHGAPAELVASFHAAGRLTTAEQSLQALITELINRAIADGSLRNDIPAKELALYCINAALGSRLLTSKAAVRRLVQITMAGLVS